VLEFLRVHLPIWVIATLAQLPDQPVQQIFGDQAPNASPVKADAMEPAHGHVFIFYFLFFSFFIFFSPPMGIFFIFFLFSHIRAFGKGALRYSPNLP
jgi:hypothetical protein